MDSANELRTLIVSWDGETIAIEYDGLYLEGSPQLISILDFFLYGFDSIVFNGTEYIRTV